MIRKTPEIIQQLIEEEQLGLMQLPKKDDEHDQIDKSSTQSYMNESNDQSLRALIKITETSNAGILIADNKGIIQYVNDTFTEITGFSYNELYAKNLKSLLSNNQQESFFKQLLTTISTGQIWTGDLENTKKNNEPYWEQVTILPITDQQGSLSYFLSIKKEITQQKQLEQSLKIKENAILSSINAIVLTDLSGKITYVNPSFLKMWSFDSEKKVIGKSVFSLWKKGNQYDTIMDNIISNGGWLGEVIACSHNGRFFPVQMSANIVKDDLNNPLSIMASFVDITMQKRMEKNYKKFKTISDEADYGTIIYDLTGVILYVNASFARTHGYQIDELIGKQLSIFYSSKKQETIDELLSELKEKGKIVGKEQVHLHKNGMLFPLLVTLTLIDDEQFHQPFIAGTMIDITQIKQAEQEIIQQAEEVNMINQELNIAREQLSALNIDLEKKVEQRTVEVNKLLKQKDRFINQLGHDLKTPLTPMLALLPLLEQRISDKDGLDYISMINRNIHYMKDLVNKTIMFAKLNSDKIKFSFVQLNLLEHVKNIQHQLRMTLEKQHAQLKITIDPSVVVFADEMQLSQVFHNLISNALKYSQQEIEPCIEISAEQSDDPMVTIKIRDNGIGMTKDQMELIFDEFYKADDARTNIDSHGLGLNICKRIIEKHGGKIWVDSESLGSGSTFYFTIRRE